MLLIIFLILLYIINIIYLAEERLAHTQIIYGWPQCTPSPPTKSFDFRGFDSNRLLILRGGNSHVR